MKKDRAKFGGSRRGPTTIAPDHHEGIDSWTITRSLRILNQIL
jgi:hypothetical protein